MNLGRSWLEKTLIHLLTSRQADKKTSGQADKGQMDK